MDARLVPPIRVASAGIGVSIVTPPAAEPTALGGVGSGASWVGVSVIEGLEAEGVGHGEDAFGG